MKKFIGLISFCFLLAATTVFAETSHVVPARMLPSEQTKKNFAGVVEIHLMLTERPGSTIEKLSGWLIGPDTLITVAHPFQRYITLNRNETRIVFYDSRDKLWTGFVSSINVKKDIAVFTINGRPNLPVLSLRDEFPQRDELFWWACGSGILREKWSVGRFLKDISSVGDRSSVLGTYLFNTLAGGISDGCSGSPVFDSRGGVVGFLRGFIGNDYSHSPAAANSLLWSGSVKTATAVSAHDIKNELLLVSDSGGAEDKGSTQPPMVPEWMQPPRQTKKNFAGVVEIEIMFQERVTHGSGWLIAPDILVTGAHFYNMSLPESKDVALKFKDAFGKTQQAVFFFGDRATDVAFFRLLDSNTGLPVLSLRKDPMNENNGELVWWFCAAGLLKDEWSLGRFLGEIPPAEALEGKYANNIYFIDSILGGVHAGCTGAPIMDYRGYVVGMTSGFMGGGSIENVLAVRAEDIRRALGFAEGQRGKKR